MKRLVFLAVILAGCGSAAADTPKEVSSLPNVAYVCDGTKSGPPAPAGFHCDGGWVPTEVVTSPETGLPSEPGGYVCYPNEPFTMPTWGNKCDGILTTDNLSTSIP